MDEEATCVCDWPFVDSENGTESNQTDCKRKVYQKLNLMQVNVNK